MRGKPTTTPHPGRLLESVPHNGWQPAGLKDYLYEGTKGTIKPFCGK